MSDFVDFYRDSYRSLIAQLSAYLGNTAEAEDVLQEAYLRAWQRWDDIGDYEDPTAWVRRVAWNLATNRWRRLVVATRYLRRQRPPEPVDGANPDRVALVDALRGLPDTHRRAVVLHYLGDLSVEQVAVELGVPRGTVLSWLHRSRVRLADLLTDSAWESALPAADRVVARARRRRTTRITATVAAILTGATAAAAFLPAIITDLPRPLTRIEDTSWTSGSITLPRQNADKPTCPSGERTISNGSGYAGKVPTGIGHIGYRSTNYSWTEMWIDGGSAIYGDLTGDGRNEAIVKVDCHTGTNWMDPNNQAMYQYLMVVSQRDGRRIAIGLAGLSMTRIIDFHIESGRVVARVKGSQHDSLTHQRTYAWNGTEVIQIAGPIQPPALPGPASQRADLVEFAAVRRNGVTICPARSEYGSIPYGGYLPHQRREPRASDAPEIDLEDDGEPEVLAFFSCETISTVCPSLFLLQYRTDRFVTLDIPLPNDGSFTVLSLTVSEHSFTATIRDIATAKTQTITMTWNGSTFVRS